MFRSWKRSRTVIRTAKTPPSSNPSYPVPLKVRVPLPSAYETMLAAVARKLQVPKAQPQPFTLPLHPTPNPNPNPTPHP